ncbi:hypothetical protein ACPCAE_22705 [Streptomyces cinereoruber]
MQEIRDGTGAEREERFLAIRQETCGMWSLVRGHADENMKVVPEE